MTITKKSFGSLSNGREIYAYELANAKGTAAQVITYGARLQSLIFNGVDVVLGYDDAASYEKDTAYMGAIAGRSANRIAKAKFKLNGKIYNLDKNDGKNHLHGGFSGFEEKVWSASVADNGVIMTVESKDGEAGYPGNFTATVAYKLTDKDEFIIDYSAKSDADTLCNLTNHAYFNLDGFGSGDVLKQKIQINADTYTWADEESIPNGKILPVENTPMDLRKPVEIGKHIDDDFDELNFAKGYDHNFCVGKLGELKKVAYAEGAKSNISMTVFTTLPGVHFYAGNFLSGEPLGKGGAKMGRRNGFALETQYYPNAINLEGVDKPILRSGETWTAQTIFMFEKK